MEAQNVNLSNVRILKALAPNIILGKGVVPPVPKSSNNENDKPMKKFRLVHTLEKYKAKAKVEFKWY